MYQALFENAGEGIIIIDLETRLISDCNPQMLANLERRRDDVIGHSSVEFLSDMQLGDLPSHELIQNAYETIMSHGQISHSLCEFKRQKGGVNSEMTISRLDMPDRVCVLIYMT